jgi:deoxycitidine kinase
MNIFNYIIRYIYKLFNYKQKKWYIVEGNIGSGKTELLNKLNEYIDCEIIKEPVDVWQNISIDEKNILQQFYENPTRYAYLFQTIVFKTRLQSIDIKQIKRYRFSERSIWTDKYVFGRSCIESNKMNKLETIAYYQWFDWLEKKFFKRPDGIIYLYCTPDKCYERVNIRSRTEETTIKTDYLNSIHDYHEEWIRNWTKTDVLIIDNTIDNDWINIIKQIEKFIQD